MEAYMWAIWLGVFVIALIVEVASTALLSIWFSLGALVALIISFIPGVAWWVQLIIFIVISSVSLLCLRPFAKKLLKANIVTSNVDEMIGKVGIMIKTYNELERGEVKINGIIWTAINTKDDEEMLVGKKVKVVAVQGNKLIVAPIEGGK